MYAHIAALAQSLFVLAVFAVPSFPRTRKRSRRT